MVQKIKTSKSKLALLATATATCLLIPYEGKAYDVRYYADTIPDSLRAKEREEIMTSNFFPYNFNFFYEIPKNEDGFKGNFELKRSRNKTELEIRVIDKHADKLLNFSEERIGDSVFYYEREFDFHKDTVLYQNRLDFSRKDRLSTIVSLVEQALNGEIPLPQFVFQGTSGSPREYKLETTSSLDNNFDLILSGEISKNSTRVPSLKVSCKRIGGRMIPVEIEVFYKLNFLNVGPFGTIHVTPNIKGILTKKK